MGSFTMLTLAAVGLDSTGLAAVVTPSRRVSARAAASSPFACAPQPQRHTVGAV